MKLPTNINEAKKSCRWLCKWYGIKEISFDDKYGNYGSIYNQSSIGGDNIDCARFSDWNYDLLVFSVLHEIGHFLQTDNPTLKNKNNFTRELDAWRRAIDIYVKKFHQNISIRQARYMVNCLNSYLPNYNSAEWSKEGIEESEHSFWCPIIEKIIH